MSDGHLKISNVIEEVAERLPDTRFGRQWRNGIEEHSDYPYDGDLLSRMAEVLQDIATGSEPDMNTLEKEVDAFVETQIDISMALDALMDALVKDGRVEKATLVRKLRRLHSLALG